RPILVLEDGWFIIGSRRDTSHLLHSYIQPERGLGTEDPIVAQHGHVEVARIRPAIELNAFVSPSLKRRSANHASEGGIDEGPIVCGFIREGARVGERAGIGE